MTSHWHNGNLAWYGAETHDHGSTLGPKHLSSNGIHMFWMQYYRSSVGAWRVVTDLVNNSDFIAFGSQPSWYTKQIKDQNYNNDEVEIWTEDH